MVAVPAATPETSPEEDTVATPVAEDTHAFVVAGDPEPVSWVGPLTQAKSVPLMVGNGLMVTTFDERQPLESL